MIWCDECHKWLHTVCVGFFSNKDKRISKQKSYSCPRCTNMGSINSLMELGLMRRILSIVYNEKFEGIKWLSRRMGVSECKARRLWSKLDKQGFTKSYKINQSDTTYVREVIKSEENREKIKTYFGGKSNIDMVDLPKNSVNIRNEEPQSSQKKLKVSEPYKDIRCYQ